MRTRVREGKTIDKQTFCTKAREYELEMYGICKAILICEKDCDDVIQDALLKAYSKLHTLREDRYFKTWLFRIVINQCNTTRKRERRFMPVEGNI